MAEGVLKRLPESGSSQDPDITWLQWQLNHLIAQLQFMMIEIESGDPIACGLWSDLELNEMLEDSVTEINNLKSLIQTLRSLGR